MRAIGVVMAAVGIAILAPARKRHVRANRCLALGPLNSAECVQLREIEGKHSLYNDGERDQATDHEANPKTSALVGFPFCRIQVLLRLTLLDLEHIGIRDVLLQLPREHGVVENLVDVFHELKRHGVQSHVRERTGGRKPLVAKEQEHETDDCTRDAYSEQHGPPHERCQTHDETDAIDVVAVAMGVAQLVLKLVDVPDGRDVPRNTFTFSQLVHHQERPQDENAEIEVEVRHRNLTHRALAWVICPSFIVDLAMLIEDPRTELRIHYLNVLDRWLHNEGVNVIEDGRLENQVDKHDAHSGAQPNDRQRDPFPRDVVVDLVM
mmetsp:Transcript_33100/g.95206  ORF Transcript_33100/g.95206 Transcript_33100/m.95206 type:complete len:322 (+) Transcript_33100:433-1398(+)